MFTMSLSQLLGEDRFQDIEKIKTIGSTYMAVSGLSPEKQVSSSRCHKSCVLDLRDVTQECETSSSISGGRLMIYFTCPEGNLLLAQCCLWSLVTLQRTSSYRKWMDRCLELCRFLAWMVLWCAFESWKLFMSPHWLYCSSWPRTVQAWVFRTCSPLQTRSLGEKNGHIK